MATNKKKKPLNSKNKFFKSPAFIGILALLVAAGVFFTFSTFAADSPVQPAVAGKDQYGCPLEISRRATLHPGNTNGCVKTVQYMMNEGIIPATRANHGVYTYNGQRCGVYFDGTLPSNPYYDTKTVAVVKTFQVLAGLQADGIVGPQTWTALTKCTGFGH